MEELLEKQRVVIYSIARALVNFKKTSKVKITAASTKQRIALLKASFTQCEQNHAKLLCAYNQEARAKEKYFTEDHFLDCEELFFEALDFMTDTQEQLEAAAGSAHNVAAGNNSSLQGTRITPSLPKIDLPKFSGESLEWESFRDHFKSVVIDNPDLAEVTRLHYLISCLKGEARGCVKNLKKTDANFEVAWQNLTERYDNTRRLVYEHIHALHSLPTVHSESAAELTSLRDQASMAVQALQNLGRPLDQADDFLVYLISQRLDKATRKAWELQLGDTTGCPTYETLDKFLATRIRAFESILPSTDSNKKLHKSVVQSHTANTLKCPVCKQNHLLSACIEFKTKSVQQRRELVNKLHRCFNCLSHKHVRKDCQSKYSCRICQKSHHSLLHEDVGSSTVSTNSSIGSESKPAEIAQVSSHLLSQSHVIKTGVLLATAWIRVTSPDGRFSMFRAMLDQGSAVTLVTERLAQRLRLKRQRISVAISGVGGASIAAQHSVQLNVSSRSGQGPSYSTSAIVLRSLTTYIPPRMNNIQSLEYLNELELADHSPSSHDKIDILIGADLYGFLLRDGVRRRASNEPVAQHTIFGWILSGVTSAESQSLVSSITTLHCCTNAELINQLRCFWEIEEAPVRAHLTEEETRCEEHFRTTHRRDGSGRYIVRIPFKTTPPLDIGDSKFSALCLCRKTEQRLAANQNQADEYNKFLGEYLDLGHMTRVKQREPQPSQLVYIPHHAVFRDTSLTSRLRVVFNASHKTSNGRSLNDNLMIGPKLQKDIVSILLRWRQYRYCYTADIAKMYRQIGVDERDVDYQRILWKFPHEDIINEYRLQTVTYGTACAPFLALRVLDQLSSDEGKNFPLAAPVLNDNVYVDDCLFGADDPLLARQTRDQLIRLLSNAGFHLRKWASNCKSLVADINPEDHGLASDKLFSEDENLKILGIAWNPENDSFRFQTSLESPSVPTKRSILSLIARMYDPLGWITPVIIIAKIFIQKLWLRGCSWDDDLPDDLVASWNKYYRELSLLQTIQIPRWVGRGAETLQCEIHGFSDASMSAYGAVVYLRIGNLDGTVRVSLLLGKSKVAPLKPMSIPRLELSAALLLVKCINVVQESISLTTTACHCWTDSTVALTWIKNHPSRWKSFVANRVCEIQTRLSQAFWHHVPTTMNPADLASRGQSAADLEHCSLWWSGPEWLLLSPDQWPKSPKTIESGVAVEERSPVSHHITPTITWDLAERYSSWKRLIRVTAYVIRFCKLSRFARHNTGVESLNSKLTLSATEIERASIHWIRFIQLQLFSDEHRQLRNQTPISKRSHLSSLSPFLDKDGLIRVGGRLRNAELLETAKHPIVLASHPLVKLIIRETHLQAQHSGPSLTLHLLRENYWLLRARQLVRSVLHACVTCTRYKADTANELMADLPQFRVCPSLRAFIHCGVDYAGPMLIPYAPGRGHRSHKAYIALFICMVTRAIHLELVSECSTAAFIVALNRFCARRGLPRVMYSDNATNFRGAQRELALAWQATTQDPNVISRLSDDGITWRFLPPSAPHFGGLWEAGVRSMKYHLKRAVGSHTLTFEEMMTLLCKVEACLNSRPIAPISDDIDDYSALTPGHFLIGSAITAIPEPTLLDERENRLTRWQLISRLRDQFWKAWLRDYLHSLQQRPKWRTVQLLARRGRIVLIRNPLVPPSQWELGRIIECHTGSDGLIRVVTVKTAKSTYTRPITKLCFLPVEINEHNDAINNESQEVK